MTGRPPEIESAQSTDSTLSDLGNRKVGVEPGKRFAPAPGGEGRPRVSVVMTAYNGSRYIREAIDSILGQTLDDFEFIIVDDCSTDDTVDVVEGFHDSRIKLIRNDTNLGICRARNIGLNAAAGYYMAALDHDDISLPQRLEKQVAFLDSNPESVLVATGSLRLENGKTVGVPVQSIDPHVLRWVMFTDNPLVHSSICVRLSALREHELEYRSEFQFADDLDLYIRLSRIGSLAYLPEPLTVYRRHSENTSVLCLDDMLERSCIVRGDAAARLLGQGSLCVIRLFKILTCKDPASSTEELCAAGDLLSRLLNAYLDDLALSPDSKSAAEIRSKASRAWWWAVRHSAKAEGAYLLDSYRNFPELSGERREVMDVVKTLASAYLGTRANWMYEYLRNRQ